MRLAVVIFGVFATMRSAWADDRKFTYSYEAQTLPAGTFEAEQWVTLGVGSEEGSFQKYSFREEIEYGVLDTLTTALYVNWKITRARDVPDMADGDEAEFETASSEWKLKIQDPSIDPVGLLAYVELSAGDKEYAVEEKIVLSKVFARFVFAFNVALEQRREKTNGDWETASELMTSAGMSYGFSPNFAIGMEAFASTDFEGTYGPQAHVAYFAGPNLHVSMGRWWLTLTIVKQVDLAPGHGLELDDHQRVEARLIVGATF